MSSATFDRPLKAVFTPNDAAQAAQALAEQKRRWGAFLSARDVVLGAVRSTPEKLAQLMQRAHMGWALTIARRTAGWLVGGATAAAGVLRTPGVRPGLVWAAFTTPGQRALAWSWSVTASPAARLGRSAFAWLLRGLRLLGHPGDRAAQKLEAAAKKAKTFTQTKLEAVQPFAGELLRPAGLLGQGVASLARARALSVLLRRLLPGRWVVVGQVLVGYFSVPASTRARMLGASPQTEPDDDPTPPAAVVNIDAARDKAAGEPDTHPSIQRYPAKRSPHASKKRR